MAQIYFNTARYQEAREQCDRLLAYPLREDIAGQLEDKLERARDLRDAAREKLND
jgi:hypothetical protein